MYSGLLLAKRMKMYSDLLLAKRIKMFSGYAHKDVVWSIQTKRIKMYCGLFLAKRLKMYCGLFLAKHIKMYSGLFPDKRMKMYSGLLLAVGWAHKSIDCRTKAAHHPREKKAHRTIAPSDIKLWSTSGFKATDAATSEFFLNRLRRVLEGRKRTGALTSASSVPHRGGSSRDRTRRQPKAERSGNHTATHLESPGSIIGPLQTPRDHSSSSLGMSTRGRPTANETPDATMGHARRDSARSCHREGNQLSSPASFTRGSAAWSIETLPVCEFVFFLYFVHHVLYSGRHCCLTGRNCCASLRICILLYFAHNVLYYRKCCCMNYINYCSSLWTCIGWYFEH